MFGKILLLGSLAFGLSKLANVGRTANTADKLEFAPSDANWGGIKTSGLKSTLNFSLSFDVLNPTRSKMDINFLFCDVFLADGKTKITSITKSNWNYRIEPEDRTRIEIPVKLNLLSLAFLGKAVRNALKEGKTPKQLQLKGYVKVNKLTVPFDEIVSL